MRINKSFKGDIGWFLSQLPQGKSCRAFQPCSRLFLEGVKIGKVKKE